MRKELSRTVSYDKLFYKDLMMLNADFSTSQQMFEFVSNELVARDFVEQSFKASIINREKNFPTGLATEYLQIAIPHTDVVHVKKPFIYVIKLEKSLPFLQMATTDKWIDVNTVFILGIKNPSKQVGLLSTIMDKFREKIFIDNFSAISNQDQMIDFLQKQFRSEE